VQHIYFRFDRLISAPAAAGGAPVDVNDPANIGIVHRGDLVSFDVELDR
jgi:hypothetical protein